MHDSDEGSAQHSIAGEQPQRAAILTLEGSDLYRLLVDRVQDYAIFALDEHGYIRSWNAGAQRLKGYAAHEIIGQHFSVFYPPDDLAAGKPAGKLAEAAATGRVEDEGWRVRKDGTYFWANVLITALRNDEGRLVGFAKVTRDLTERRAADEAIRESEERFRLLVQSVKDYAIFMLDATGHVATWNDGASRIKGYTADEIIGRHFSTFYPPEDIAAGKAERELALAVRNGVYEEEGWRVRKDGTRFWANVVLTPVYNKSVLTGFAKVTRDLTERRAAHLEAIDNARRIAAEEAARAGAERQANELRVLADRLREQAAEIERRSAELEAANRVKGEFLAAMSHELRTPLNAIGGYAQLIQLGVSGPVTPEQMQNLDRIQQSQVHLLGIINDILNFSRIEAGHVTYDIEPVSLHDVIDRVTSMIAVQAESGGLRLSVDCPAALIVQADQGKLEQILLNLLSNAVKFTPAGGSISVGCDAAGAEARIRVRDTGIGVPAQYIDEIFAPFVQVGRQLDNPKMGTGLGLAISRDLARAMHGELRAESVEGEGSTFTLTLPRVE